MKNVQKVTIFDKNLHFPEGVDHVYMTLEYDLKFEIVKNLNPRFIRLEKLKINKIVNLMNRRAKNLLSKYTPDMDKYDYLVQIFNNIEKNILNFKYRIDDFYRNTRKIKTQRRIKNKKLKFALQKGINKNLRDSRYKDYLLESRKLHYLKRIKDKEMILRSHDFFSKSHIKDPRKWWQKTKWYFKKYEDKN